MGFMLGSVAEGSPSVAEGERGGAFGSAAKEGMVTLGTAATGEGIAPPGEGIAPPGEGIAPPGEGIAPLGEAAPGDGIDTPEATGEGI